MDSSSKLLSISIMFFIALTFFPLLSTAQNLQDNTISTPSSTPDATGRNDLAPLEGTYQLQVINTRGNPKIPEDLAQQIRSNRLANDVNNIWLGTHVRLMILSETEINVPAFQPLQQEIVWLNE